MKFPSIAAFDKHLKHAFPDHLAPIFMIVMGCDYERRKIFDQIAALVRRKDPDLQIVRLNGLDHPLKRVHDELFTPSLFGGSTLVIYDAADKVKNLDELYSTSFPPKVHFLVGAAAFKPLGELYLKGKKEIVALDMSEEKPWDKERRLQVSLAAQGLSPDIVAFLMGHLGSDSATLDQEVAKLLCYVGDRRPIQLKDVQAICSSRDLLTGWQLAEKIVWERAAALGDKPTDPNFFFPFIGQLRYHLQLGFRLAELLAQQSPDIRRHFPSLRPAQLDKFIPVAQSRRPYFFQRGLKALYNLEVASKSTQIDVGALFDYFQSRLYEKTLPTS
jgi:DNA polymerase III subunit delta